MAIIKAFFDSVGGNLADQWLEVIEEKCGTKELEKLILNCEKQWQNERRGGY